MTEPISPGEFAETVADLPETSVDRVAVEDAYEVERARATTPGHQDPRDPYDFVGRLKHVAGLECPDFVDTIIASVYQHHIRAARSSAADAA